MLLFLCIVSFQNNNDIMSRIEEEVAIDIGGMVTETYVRDVFIYRKFVRVDYPGDNSLIYNLNMHTLCVIEKSKKRYFYVRYAPDDTLARRPLLPFGRMQDGLLTRPSNSRPIAEPTGALQKISNLDCTEYRLNYPKKSGIDVRIWSAKIIRPHDIDKRYRKIWTSAFGTHLPADVTAILKAMLNGVKGTPIRTITTMNKEGLQVTTTVTVIKIRQKEIEDDSFFQIPDNFSYADADAEDRPWLVY